MKRHPGPIAALLLLASPLGLAACADAPAPDLRGAGLTAEICEFAYEQLAGETRICHRTTSAKHRYVVIRTSLPGCVDGHANHAEDYIAWDDPTCSGEGCYPLGAPTDGIVECCEGLEAVDGRCAEARTCTGEGDTYVLDPNGYLTCCEGLVARRTDTIGVFLCGPDLCADVECEPKEICYDSGAGGIECIPDYPHCCEPSDGSCQPCMS